MKQYNVTIVRVRRNTGPAGGAFVCERGSWQRDTLRGKRDHFRVVQTFKVGTREECQNAAIEAAIEAGSYRDFVRAFTPNKHGEYA